MSHARHFTTRRGFVGAMGFGALGLYATWAAYGASPLPFAGRSASHADPDAGPTIAEHYGAPSLSPEEFTRRHAAFLTRFRQADGSVRPVAAAPAETAHDHAAPAHPMAMTDMPDMVHADHDHDHDAGGGGPVAVYFAAGRFAFAPDDLRLAVGQSYCFHMMATDVAHGASIAFGRASRIVRLRPDLVTSLDLTFRERGRYLVYCTVYCGPGHDSMHGLITVA